MTSDIRIDRVKQELQSASNEQLARIATRLAHQLTVLARGTYDPDSETVADPRHLRRLNEAMHRIIAALGHALDGEREPALALLLGYLPDDPKRDAISWDLATAWASACRSVPHLEKAPE